MKTQGINQAAIPNHPKRLLLLINQLYQEKVFHEPLLIYVKGQDCNQVNSKTAVNLSTQKKLPPTYFLKLKVPLILKSFQP